MTRSLPFALVLGLLVPLAGDARGAGAFESLHCLKYAQGADYPVDAILFGTDRGETFDTIGTGSPSLTLRRKPIPSMMPPASSPSRPRRLAS